LIAKLLYLQIWLHTPCYAAVSLFCNIPFRQISPHGSKLKMKSRKRLIRAWVLLVVLTGLGIAIALQAPAIANAAACVPGDGTTPCQDAFEPNDDPASARPLSASPTISLTFFNTTDSVNDTDWYQVVIATNQVFTLTVNALNTGGNIQVAGFANGAQTAVGTSLNNGQSATAVISNTAGNAQTFYFRVNNAAGSFYYYQAQYAVGFVPVAITPTPIGAGPDPFEPNDTPAQVFARPGGIASFINTNSQIVNVNFYPQIVSGTPIFPITATGAAGDIDWYFFYGKKALALGGTGGCYRIQTVAQPGVDTYMAVYLDPPGLPMAQNDDTAPLNRSSQLNFLVSENGRYWIKVWNLDSSPRGAGQTYNISVVENFPTTANCTLLYTLRAYLPIQVVSSPNRGIPPQPTTAPAPAVTVVPAPTAYQLGPVILVGSVSIANVNAAAGNAFDEYADIFNTGNAPVTLVDWKIRVGGQVYNLSNPPGTQLQLLPKQGCRVYTGTNVGPVALPEDYNACGAKFLGVTSGIKIYPNTIGYRIELLNESNTVVAYYGR